MLIRDVVSLLEQLAPPSYQESYDNTGLIVGSFENPLKGILLSIDVTPDVVEEAYSRGANMIIAHHPLIFSGLKKITGKTYTEKAIITAVKKDIAIYAAHTNLDNVLGGVNSKIGEKLDLKGLRFLVPAHDYLVKLAVFAPHAQAEAVRNAMFDAGAGHIGDYDSCSYNSQGVGSFRGNENTNPFVGEKGMLHIEPETKIEVIVPKVSLPNVLKAMLVVHPYEEVAYDIYPLLNEFQGAGTGMIGYFEQPLTEMEFLNRLKTVFSAKHIRHTQLLNIPVRKVAYCGGSGAQLLDFAIAAGANVFVSADFKYHQFFDANKNILIADIGHFESEQFTVDIFYDFLLKKLSNFAVFKSEIITNPINYL